MNRKWRARFTNGIPWHTIPYLESIEPTFNLVTAGTSWVWLGAGNQILPPPWTATEFVEFGPGGQVFGSWLWHKPL